MLLLFGVLVRLLHLLWDGVAYLVLSLLRGGRLGLGLWLSLLLLAEEVVQVVFAHDLVCGSKK